MGVERTDRARDSRQALFHEIRRSLNGAVLQVEGARLDPGHSARSAAALNSSLDLDVVLDPLFYSRKINKNYML